MSTIIPPMNDELVTWCVVPPTAGPHAYLSPIGRTTSAADIVRLRAELMFDAPPDALDPQAFQIAVRHGDSLVGCVRVNPSSVLPPSAMARLIGPDMLQTVFDALDVSRGECWDGEGWVVAPGYRRSGLGANLGCAAMAVAKFLGGRRLVGIASARKKKGDRLVMLGASAVASVPTADRDAEDAARVVAFDLDAAMAPARERMEPITAMLRSAWPAQIPTVKPPRLRLSCHPWG